MKPRDNRMYYISEHSNLRKNDDSLKEQQTKLYAVFDRQIVTDLSLRQLDKGHPSIVTCPSTTSAGGPVMQFENIWTSQKFKTPINYASLQQMIDLSIQKSNDIQVQQIGEEALEKLLEVRR